MQHIAQLRVAAWR